MTEQLNTINIKWSIEILIYGRFSRLLCYWAAREPGFSTTSVANKLGMQQSSVSRAKGRAQRLATAKHLLLEVETNA